MLVLIDSVSILGIPKSLPAKATGELDTKMEEIAEELATESVAGRKIKLWKAALSDHKTKVEPRAAQKWANNKARFSREFDGSVREFQLERNFCVGDFILYEYNLTSKRATLQSLARNSAENLEKCYQWAQKWVETTDMNYLTNCVSVDEAGFNINMRSLNALVQLEGVFKPKKVKVDGSRKRKMPSISKTLDEMNKFPEKRNFYIVMDNAPIHTSQDITNLIEIRDYEAIYLPPYSSELNSIENFWSVVKNSIKRSVFQETEDLKTRISEVSQSVSRKTLHNITQHSVENFQKCFDKEPL
ncbi:hypothetical protein G6F29_010666 [Rhizopus arrhizus]|nr:hypothetical protein G6F23_007512 [Rhizopus arrhizus]KAG0911765.1 hypothetical protein G6F33_006698 [Rhizopus arrhizus]KAG0932822.1 hypothetical protein G6F30_010555 [Rhizopus arrhizus]KAG0976625.1 hypothetical protein G6F29_010666 [Rhizopus arrhizus]KAG1019764.1 hypothetical protein G6F26_009851 [Rhizopus arrhizus]